MPNRIDTSKIKRIELYRSIIESASIVPSTSQDTLNKTVANMKLELSDLDVKARNLMVLIGLINCFVIFTCVFVGYVILIPLPILLTMFTLAINNIREEVTAFNVPTSELTEGCSNVPPLSPTTRIYWH